MYDYYSMISFINLPTTLRISLSSIFSNQKSFCSLSKAEKFPEEYPCHQCSVTKNLLFIIESWKIWKFAFNQPKFLFSLVIIFFTLSKRSFIIYTVRITSITYRSTGKFPHILWQGHFSLKTALKIINTCTIICIERKSSIPSV